MRHSSLMTREPRKQPVRRSKSSGQIVVAPRFEWHCLFAYGDIFCMDQRMDASDCFTQIFEFYTIWLWSDPAATTQPSGGLSEPARTSVHRLTANSYL